MTQPTRIDWNAAEQEFLAKSLQAIRQLENEHPGVLLSFFAFRSNYYYGNNSIVIDSYENSLQQAKAHQQWVFRNRQTTMTHAKSAQDARYHWQIASKRIVDYTPNVGEFWQPDYLHVNFSEWEEFFRGETVDENVGSQGHVILLFWRVLEKLVQQNAFDRLQLAPLFRLGFQFEDDDLGLVVSHILQWPTV